MIFILVVFGLRVGSRPKHEKLNFPGPNKFILAAFTLRAGARPNLAEMNFPGSKMQKLIFQALGNLFGPFL